jgi:AcrR family transcriptional regulator
VNNDSPSTVGYTPRSSTAERSREIREIAARYIAERGLWKFSMLALARHLKCLLPTLCYYYKKREELITDIVLRHVETLRSRAGLAIDGAAEETPTGKLRAFAREYLLVALAEREAHKLTVIYGDLAGPEDGEPFYARWELLREVVERLLAASAPEMPRDACRALSRTLLDALNGAARWLEPYGLVHPVDYAGMIVDWVLGEARRHCAPDPIERGDRS